MVRPGMGALDNPATGSVARDLHLGCLLFAAPADLRGVAEGSHCLPHGVVVIPLVQAQMLRLLWRRRGAVAGDRLQNLCHPLHVVAIGTFHGQPNGHALAIGEQGALGAFLAPISGVRAGAPPQGALWSSPHPSPATPSRCLSVRHTPVAPLSTASPRRLLCATADNGRERCCLGTAHAVSPSLVVHGGLLRHRSPSERSTHH